MDARPLLACAPMFFMIFAGCFDEGAAGTKAMDAVDVPVWKPGYSWTYDVTASYHVTYSEDGRIATESDTETDTITMSVANDTLSLEEEDVYILRSSGGDLEHPFLMGTVQALAKSDLALAGFSYRDYDYSVPRPIAEDVAYSYPHYESPQPRDPCEGVTVLTPIPREDRFAALRFPLDDGQTWSGTWSPEPRDEVSFSYTAKVHGLTSVQVPAGVFPAVYVEADLRPNVPADYRDDDFPSAFKVHSEAWYSPDVQYLTKMVVSAEATGIPGAEGGGPARFGFVSTLALRDFSLVEGPAEPLEIATQDLYDDYAAQEVMRQSFVIAADQEMPIELGQGPVTVNLGLAATKDFTGYDGRTRSMPEGVPEKASIDHSTHEVVWMVGRAGDWQRSWQEIRGDTASVTLQEGGRYIVQAHVLPIKCGAYTRSFLSADLTTIVSREFSVQMEPGMPASKKVGVLPIAPELSRIRFEIEMEPTAGVSIDSGHLDLYGPYGERRQVYGAYAEDQLHPGGDWRMMWISDQPTIGDDVRIRTVEIYDPWYG